MRVELAQVNLEILKKLNKEYKISKLAIGLKTFMLIYYNLYQTNQFHKVLEYANSISYLKVSNTISFWVLTNFFYHFKLLISLFC